MLLPARCPLCLAAGPAPCLSCWAQLRPAPRLLAPAGLDRCAALVAYDDHARALLTGLKGINRRDAVGWLAGQLARLGQPVAGAVVTWAPTSALRRRQRGFDQAELLARALARRWRRPARRLLVRRPGSPQAGRSGIERRRHRGFDAIGRAPAQVVLVDDVSTTGATLSAAAVALRSAGSREVSGLVVARALPPGTGP